MFFQKNSCFTLILFQWVLLAWANPETLEAFGPPCPVTDQSCLDEIKLEVKEMFFHAYDNYLEKAFPDDELKPIACKGRSRSKYESRGHMDDTLGNFSLTLVDSVDTLFILDEIHAFEEGVELILDHVQFDKDIKVSVFETTIRVLGGLLSIHSFIDQFPERFSADFLKRVNYQTNQSRVLDLASDLGDRLLPSFQSPTHIPFSRVNLKHGLPAQTTSWISTAEAGSLILEFGLLSEYTGNPVYYEKAYSALEGLWSRRSRLDLVGELIDVKTGSWRGTTAGIGSGSDSFYEYLLKSYLLFGNLTFLDMFDRSYSAVNHYLKANGVYYQGEIASGKITRDHATSLQAFWPGLQIMYGDIQSAVAYYDHFARVMDATIFLPESWSLNTGIINIASYPLRPEFVESTYWLYRMTGHPYYLGVAQEVVKKLQLYTRTECGFAAYDVYTRTKEDRMDSFFLSETLKYLYLLFDVDNPINFLLNDWVFTTEAHLFPKLHEPEPFEPEFSPVCEPIFHPVYSDQLNFNYQPTPTQPIASEKPIPEKQQPAAETAYDNLDPLLTEKIISREVELSMIPEASVLARLRFEGNSWLSLSDILAVPAFFGAHLNTTGIRGQLEFGNPISGCDPQLGDELRGKIAVFIRGKCSFAQKYVTAQASGSIAMLVVHDSDMPVYMTTDQPLEPTIPALQIKTSDGGLISRVYSEQEVSLFAAQEYRFDKQGRIHSDVHVVDLDPEAQLLRVTFPQMPMKDLQKWVMKKLATIDQSLISLLTESHSPLPDQN